MRPSTPNPLCPPSVILVLRTIKLDLGGHLMGHCFKRMLHRLNPGCVTCDVCLSAGSKRFGGQ